MCHGDADGEQHDHGQVARLLPPQPAEQVGQQETEGRDGGGEAEHEQREAEPGEVVEAQLLGVAGALADAGQQVLPRGR